MNIRFCELAKPNLNVNNPDFKPGEKEKGKRKREKGTGHRGKRKKESEVRGRN